MHQITLSPEDAVHLFRYEDDLHLFQREVQHEYGALGVVIPKEAITALPQSRRRPYWKSAEWMSDFQKGSNNSSPTEQRVVVTTHLQLDTPFNHLEEHYLWRLWHAAHDVNQYRREVRAQFAPKGVSIPDKEISALPDTHPLFRGSALWLKAQRKLIENWLNEKPHEAMNEKRYNVIEGALPNILRDSNDELILWNLRLLGHDLALYREEVKGKYAKYGVELKDNEINVISAVHPKFGYSGQFQAAQQHALRKYLHNKKTSSQTVEHLHQVFGKHLLDPKLLMSSWDEEFRWKAKAYPIVWKAMRSNWPKAEYLPPKRESYEGLGVNAYELGYWAQRFLMSWRLYNKAKDPLVRKLNPASRARRIDPQIMEPQIDLFRVATGLWSPHLGSSRTKVQTTGWSHEASQSRRR
jgi:hypothetical protein